MRVADRPTSSVAVAHRQELLSLSKNISFLELNFSRGRNSSGRRASVCLALSLKMAAVLSARWDRVNPAKLRRTTAKAVCTAVISVVKPCWRPLSM